jgi:hypothetical protein
MEELEEKFRKENGTLTYEEILEILEAELYEDNNNPYRPLDFHDDDEDF